MNSLITLTFRGAYPTSILSLIFPIGIIKASFNPKIEFEYRCKKWNSHPFQGINLENIERASCIN